MMDPDKKIRYAVEHTELIRPPQQHLATFGATTLDYYVVTGLAENLSVVRDGKVIAEKPRIVTPSYLARLQGFSDEAKKYFAHAAREHPDEPGIFYQYKNRPKQMNVVSEPTGQVIGKLNAQLENEHNPLSTIIKGIEELWDVSLLMFIYHLTRQSINSNVSEFRSRGFFNMDASGLPKEARNHIEELFDQVRKDMSRAPELVTELNRWNVFPDYQDRFFNIFKKR